MATVTHLNATANTAVSPLTSGAFTPAANDLLVVFVVATGELLANGTLSSSDGLTFTKQVTTTKATAHPLYLFVADSLANAVSQTVTFDDATDPTTGQIIFVAGVAGMSKTGATAVRQTAVQADQAAGGTPAPVFASAALTGNPTLGLVGNADNPAAVTPPTDWTEAADTGYNSPSTGGEYVFRDSGFTGTTITWGSTSSTAFGTITVELDASGGTPTTVSDTPTGVRLSDPTDAVNGGVRVGDTPSAVQLGGIAPSVVANPSGGTTVNDTPGSVQLSGLADTTRLGTRIGDTPSGLALVDASPAVWVGIVISDGPTTLRLTSGIAEIRIGVRVLDRAGGLQLSGLAPSVVANPPDPNTVVNDRAGAVQFGGRMPCVTAHGLTTRPTAGTTTRPTTGTTTWPDDGRTCRP